ncbi:MAG TPA: hypothetical protein VMT68_02930 [Caulobacteraceae bacterium]|nr:hypothetical protein [Caulobacteraceae bacterium]
MRLMQGVRALEDLALANALFHPGASTPAHDRPGARQRRNLDHRRLKSELDRNRPFVRSVAIPAIPSLNSRPMAAIGVSSGPKAS